MNNQEEKSQVLGGAIAEAAMHYDVINVGDANHTALEGRRAFFSETNVEKMAAAGVKTVALEDFQERDQMLVDIIVEQLDKKLSPEQLQKFEAETISFIGAFSDNHLWQGKTGDEYAKLLYGFIKNAHENGIDVKFINQGTPLTQQFEVQHPELAPITEEAFKRYAENGKDAMYSYLDSLPTEQRGLYEERDKILLEERRAANVKMAELVNGFNGKVVTLVGLGHFFEDLDESISRPSTTLALFDKVTGNPDEGLLAQNKVSELDMPSEAIYLSPPAGYPIALKLQQHDFDAACMAAKRLYDCGIKEAGSELSLPPQTDKNIFPQRTP